MSRLAEALAAAAKDLDADLSETRHVLSLIISRGYDRQRDLPRALDELLGPGPSTDRN